MGEPVPEEMLATWFGEPDADNCARCHHAMQTRYDCEPTALCDNCAHEVGPMLVAEVRRLRDALTQASRTHAEGWTGGYDHGTAEGYARAERDVVAFITSAIDHDAERMRATAQRGNAMQSNAYAAGHTALSLTRKRIEDHCHRGAAKDEAPRGEEET